MSVLDRRLRAVIFLALLGVLAVALPARAHERAVPPVVPGGDDAVRPVADAATRDDVSGESLVSAVGGADFPAEVMLVVATALTLFVAIQPVTRRRRVVAVLLIVVVAGIGFETGVHSVHHLGDPGGDGHCAVAASADHVVPVIAAVPADVPPIPAQRASRLDHSASPPMSGDYRADVGRAPPSSAS